MKQQIFSAIVALVTTASVFGQAEKKQKLPPLSVDSFAAKISRQSRPQIIDARTREEFVVNHIHDAVNIDQFAGNYLDELQKFDKAKPVFIYAIQNYPPGILAKQLLDLGYDEVYELKSGIANWIGSGCPYYSGVKNIVSQAAYKKTISNNKLVLVDIGTKYRGTCAKVKQVVDSLKENGDPSN